MKYDDWKNYNPGKRTLIVTVGLPYSGKSTWAKFQGLPMVCPDALRYAIYNQRFNSEYESTVWQVAHFMVKSLFIAGHKKVILDSTSITRQRRVDWESSFWDTRYKYFDAPCNMCMERASKANDFEILPVIENMNNKFEPLGNDELLFNEERIQGIPTVLVADL